MRAILVDLDGALLPLAFDRFLPSYLGLMGRRFAGSLPGVDVASALLPSTPVPSQPDLR